ncbi:cell division control protein [Ceratobasidium sp. AG-Ba]|nr:cell division control protein [Ceratobasidium sp. AG-Ba]
MSARRQASTTSLSRYARDFPPEVSDNSLDFCNSFWGLGDGGVDVLFARMRGATRTAEELRAYWKERALIEEEYAKRLQKLAKTVLGRDEIGELRNSFDALRLETDKQANSHLVLASQIKKDLEAPVADFIAKQAAHKKNTQAPVEKLFKTKQTQENHVNRTREKYESDCIKINAFTGQSALVQGRELDKLHLKLDKLQETVKINEREFQNFVRALTDTTQKWDKEWKQFCDSCQDLEDERIEFMKDNMWNYANSISTNHDGTPYKQTARPANFIRSSSRPIPIRQPPPPPEPEQEEEPVNQAGVGAGGGRRGRAESISAGGDGRTSRATSRARRDSMPPQPPASIVNGHGPPPQQQQQPPPQQQPARTVTAPTPAPVPHSPAMHPPHAGSVPLPGMVNRQGPGPGTPGQERTMLQIGQNAYDVDPSADPQNAGALGRMGSVQTQAAARPPAAVGDATDPLAQQLANLRSGGPAPGRNPTRRGTMETPGPGPGAGPGSRQGTTPSRAGGALQAPAGAFTAAEHAHAQNQALNRDYQYSAEAVVGAHPSRPTTPTGPSPTAEFMRPRGQSINAGQGGVEDVVARYGQALPNERRLSVSRPGPGQGPPARSPSPAREGYAGIGARRSPSPAPVQQQQQHVPPQQQPQRRHSGIYPPQGQQGGMASPYPPQQGGATSPSPFGIALDASGHVAQDSMADAYARQYGQQPPPQQQTPQPQQMPPQQQQMPPQQRPQSTYYGQQPGYGGQTPGPGGMYGGATSPAPPSAYGQQQPPPPQQHGIPPQQQHPMYQQYPNGQQSPYSPGPQAAGGYYPQQQQQQQPYGQPGYGQQQPGANQPPPQQQQQQPAMTRTPSPLPPQQPQGNVQGGAPPTGQYLDDGSGVLFYVKAMYNYTATIEEEFDFQEGDIIAVTSTPEDGWWHGVLLDDTRRVPGRTVFPSNFVTLF